MLLSCCEITTYRIFEGLIAPAKLADKNSSELVSVMKDHQNRKRNPIAERFIFNSRNRKLKENISNYMTELRRLSQYLQVWRFPGKKNATWQISLWCKSRGNAATIAKWRCVANPIKDVRYRSVARICNSTSSSYTKRESERE